MPSSPALIGKRPDFKQSKSAGWSWPRLVPIHEQQSRLSQVSQSSASPSLRDHHEQEEPPPKMIATMISKLQGEESAPLSPVPSTAGKPPTAGGSVLGAADHQPYEHMPGSLLSAADLNDEGSRAASRNDARSTPDSVEDSAGENLPGTKRGSVQDAAEKDFSTSNPGSVQETAEKTSLTSIHGSVHDVADTLPGSEHEPVQQPGKKPSSLSKDEPVRDMAEKSPSSEGRLVRDIAEMLPGSEREFVQDSARKTSSVSQHGSVQDEAEKSPDLEPGSVGDVADRKFHGSRSGSVEAVPEISTSASEHGLIEGTTNQDDTEIPVAYENTVIDVPLQEEKPATPPSTPIPPVMDRISVASTPFPYHATPKIMVHKPSQSSSEDTPSSRTIDEVLANECQKPAQETNPQRSQSTPDGTPIDGSPMQSMSLKPIAWQAPKDQKIRKRKLYLRKFRNAAARKTILKATLGRQLAIPTKEMLRLLADGENLTIPDISKPGVEAATMLVPQDAVGSFTGAILLPHGIPGAVADA